MSADDHTISTTFIYGLAEPETGVIRYVGKSNNPNQRLSRHMAQSRTGKWHAAIWVASLVAKGLRPIVVILEKVATDDWPAAEIRWIKKLRDEDCDLTNTTEGGMAPEITEGTRAKMSAAKKEKGQPWIHTPESRAKAAATKRGKKRGPMPTWWRAKIGAAQKDRVFSEEHCRKISEAKMGHQVSEETRKKISATHLGSKQPEEVCQKLSEAMKKVWAERRQKS